MIAGTYHAIIVFKHYLERFLKRFNFVKDCCLSIAIRDGVAVVVFVY